MICSTMLRRLAAIGILALVLVPAAAARDPITAAGWRLTPAGTVFQVSQLADGMQKPFGSALSPDGTHLIAVSSGAATLESADYWDLAAGVDHPVLYSSNESVFYGAVFSPDGKRAWVSGGAQNAVHSYDVTPSGLHERARIAAPFFPAGIAYGRTPLGDRMYVAENMSSFSGPDSYGNPPGHTVTVIDPKTDTVIGTIDLGLPLYPLGVTFDRTGAWVYVTNWTGRSVSVIDTATQAKIADVELSPLTNPLLADHPNGITFNPRRDEVYTSNGNSDTVSVIDTRTQTVAATIFVGLTPSGAKGSMPEGLAVSPNGRTLYVAVAAENAIAVVDLDRRAVLGFIPTGWNPASVQVTPDGKKLVVTNTYGSGAGPNRCGPNSPLPASECTASWETQYIGTMIKGSVEVIRVPERGDLGDLSDQVRENNRADERSRRMPSALSPIKHVIYVIKENRTYDQVFGDLGKGNGDPSLTIFHDESAPNHRELARRFVLFDNFYVDAEVSADGHPWSTQAVATDYVQMTWPIDYSAYPRWLMRYYDEEYVFPYEQFASEPLASDPSVPRSASAATVGYLWDNAFDHGVSFRDYGEGTPWDDPSNCGSTTISSDLTRLSPRFGVHVAPRFPGWNMACSDHAVREPAWKAEFDQYVANGNLPGLSIVYLPNDHTTGTYPGGPTPQAYMADNDLALGRMVDAVSHSRYWKDTAIVVLEDDAQDGPDHVDAHRSPVLVISPYTQTGRVDSTHYDTAAAIATVEDLLGLPPMSIYDQRATRMWAAFASRPNTRPYDAITPTVVPFGAPGYPVNSASAPFARASQQMDWSRPDAIDEATLNVAVWKSIRGRGSRMPAPRHTLLVSPLGRSSD